uniref:F-box domain-containing protein n=1 Tax=Psilocybe cubensis TaxID=181762 RepID=A0A8H8CLS5_PSICU
MTSILGSMNRWILHWVKDFFLKTRPYIFRIPVELIIEILKFLEWREVLLVRQTCKYLAGVTTSRAIWKGLVDEYLVTSFMPPKIERPLASHSSQELECLFLRWKSADLAFGSDKFITPQERTFMGPKTYSVRLITGGRWLLSIQQTGAVQYYDLDAEMSVAVELIPAQSEEAVITSTIDYDMDAPFLKFNIAFCYKSEDALEMESHKFRGNRCICKIWNVKAILDDTRHVIGLIATQIAWFPFGVEVNSVPMFSLLGSNLACITHLASLAPSYEPCLLRIINWQQAHENPLRYTFRVVERLERQACVQLLPTGKILVTEYGNYKLYDYLSIPEGNYTPEQPISSYQPIWNIKGPSCDWPFNCFFTGSRAYVIIGEYALVSMLAFDYVSPSGTPPSMNIVYRDKTVLLQEKGTYVGAKRTIALVRLHTLRILDYSSFTTSKEPVVLRQEGVTNINIISYLIADDNIGRCVCIFNGYDNGKYKHQTEFHVVDFGRLPKQVAQSCQAILADCL